jgi:hypothetical protein
MITMVLGFTFGALLSKYTKFQFNNYKLWVLVTLFLAYGLFSRLGM